MSKRRARIIRASWERGCTGRGGGGGVPITGGTVSHLSFLRPSSSPSLRAAQLRVAFGIGNLETANRRRRINRTPDTRSTPRYHPGVLNVHLVSLRTSPNCLGISSQFVASSIILVLQRGPFSRRHPTVHPSPARSPRSVHVLPPFPPSGVVD